MREQRVAVVDDRIDCQIEASPAFAAAAHRQSAAVARSPQAAEDQCFIDAISE
jgi:hypothetical protein